MAADANRFLLDVVQPVDNVQNPLSATSVHIKLPRGELKFATLHFITDIRIERTTLKQPTTGVTRKHGFQLGYGTGIA